MAVAMAQADREGLLSKEHFPVGGMLIEARSTRLPS